MIVTVSLEGEHVPLLIVQTNLFAPADKFVTPEPGLPGVVTVAVPVITVHVPVPIAGVFPARVAVVEHNVWSGPAFEVVGGAFLAMTTVSLDGAQLPLLIVHTNVLLPTDNPVTPEVGLPGVATTEPPAITVHRPVPTVGVFPAREAAVKQTV